MLIAVLVNLLILLLVGAFVWWVLFTLIGIPARWVKPVQIIVALIFLLLALGTVFGGVSLFPFVSYR